MNTNNPLILPYGTPHDTIPFDKITLEHYEEAFLEGIKRSEEMIDIICNDPEEPTFDNTIARTTDKKHYYDLLDRTETAFFNLLSAEKTDGMDELAQKMMPLLTKHANDVSLNKTFFERTKHVYDVYHNNVNDNESINNNTSTNGKATLGKHRKLTPEEERLLQKCYDGFVRSGALLSDKDKDRLRMLTEEASNLSLQFSQNLINDTKAFILHITDETELCGLPETSRSAAAQAAREHFGEKAPGNVETGNDGYGWIFTLDAPSMRPFLTYSDCRDLRKKMYMAYNTLCTHDNSSNNFTICQRLVNLRRELAQLLGYDTYAAYLLEHRMASNVSNVYKMLDELVEAYRPAAVAEREELESYARKQEGEAFVLEAWDTAYYSHKLKKEQYDIDAEMLRPYLRLENVIKGVFGLATTLYGITFRENRKIPVYHPDVKAYEVFDNNGAYLAVLYADFHPRAGKQSGAWMTEFQEQFIDDDGTNVRPHISLVMNFTKPTPEKPALLTLGEVNTFLHEFGHSLHGMFANTRFSSMSGTSVWRDFVELPSQFMENYSIEKDFLKTFAVHYETGETIPDDLIERVQRSRNFHVAMACLQQVKYGLLDMAYYTLDKEFTEDIVTFEKKAWQKACIEPQMTDTCMTVQFSHIMAGGYSAGYYGYKWSEVLDADAFAVFKREGIFNTETAQRFRDTILSKGGTAHPMTLYKRFKGSEPSIDALLERDGIKKECGKQELLDKRYLRMAAIWAENSYCQRRKVGCLVVKDKRIISDGYNGTPSGFENVCEDDNNITKPYVLHAEANAITKLARSHNNSEGATLYVTDSPCIECAKLIIQSGIKRIVYSQQYRLTDGIDLLRRAGIEIVYLPKTDKEG